MVSVSPEEVECSIAVLCYRAGQVLIPFVEELHRLMEAQFPSWEIVLVANDWPGSQDETPRIAKELATRLSGVRCVAEPKAGAMGWDMRQGLESCRGRYLGVVDGDGQVPAEAVVICFDTIRREDWDIVKSYRQSRCDGSYRRAITLVYNWLFHAFFSASRVCRDINSKPKVLRRSAYQKMKLRSDDWFIDAEIILAALESGLRIHEVPITFQALEHRNSFTNAGTILEFLRNMLTYRLQGRGKPPR